jgi:ribonuclease HI
VSAARVEWEIWTDGGCQGNPGPGGWAFVLKGPEGAVERSGFEPATTNNRMELTAVREALGELRERAGSAARAAVRTDSQYVQKGITQWIFAWQKNGWKTSAKQPVKNSELWQALAEVTRGLELRWEWVLGHAGNEMNERCDALVQDAIGRGTKALKRQG